MTARPLFLAFLACCSLLFSPPPARAEEQPPAIQLTLTPALSGAVKLGNWAALVVEVTNDGPEVSGELAWDLGQTWGSQLAYATRHSLPATLAAGDRKRFTIHVPAVARDGTVAVRWVAGGRQVAEAKVTLSYTDDVQVGLLGAQREDLAPLAVAQLPSDRKVSLLQLDPRTLPDRAQALANLDALLLRGFSASELTPEQRVAVQQWVEDGGILMLVGGPEATRTLGGWQPWLPVRVVGQAQVALDSLGDQIGADLKGAGDISLLDAPDAHVLLTAEQHPLAVTWRKGSGTVLVLAADPTLDPLHGWSGAVRFWQCLLTPALGWQPPEAALGDPPVWSELAQSAKALPGEVKLPAASNLGLLYGLYVLLLGPVNFFLLRRWRRADWAWVTVPVLAVGCTAGTWAYAQANGVARFAAHQVSVVLLDGSDQARVQTLVGAIIPADSAHDLELGPDMFLMGTGGSEHGSFGSRGDNDSSPVGLEIRGGHTGPVHLPPLGLWSLRAIGAETVVPAPGRLTADLTLTGTSRLTGAVTNGTEQPVQGAVVIYGNHATWVGDLQPGQTASLGESISMQIGREDAWTTGSPLPPGIDPVLSRNVRRMMLSRNTGRGEFTAWLSSPYDPTRPWIGADSARNFQTYLRRRGPLYALGLANFDPTQPIILGWSDWLPTELKVDGRSFHPEATTLLAQPATFAIGKGPFTLPGGHLPARLLDWSAPQDRRGAPQTSAIPAGGSATLEYTLPVAAATVSRLLLEIPESWPARWDSPGLRDGFTVELYDWEAGAWRTHPYENGRTEIRAPGRYVSPEQTVQVRVGHRGDDDRSTGTPILTVSGEVN